MDDENGDKMVVKLCKIKNLTSTTQDGALGSPTKGLLVFPWPWTFKPSLLPHPSTKWHETLTIGLNT